MQTPRKLTLHQQAVLIQGLLMFPDQHVDVCYSPLAFDALGYAQDFLTIFKVIGWKVHAPSESLIVQPGLAFLAGERGVLPPSAEALRDTLRIYGIEVATVCDPSREMKSADFVLAIGSEA
jgi:hypothetical protein